MSKVTITIDDKSPALVSMFGENALNTIANAMRYQEKIALSEEELPEKVCRDLTEQEMKSGMYGDMTVTQICEYPEGTVLTKNNPDTRAQYVGKTILREKIIPALLENFEKVKKNEALAGVAVTMKQASEVLEQVAVIEVTE